MAFNGALNSKKLKSGVVGALDIGSSKICCVIARVGDDGIPTIIGSGHHASQGVRCGNIVDMEAAIAAIGTTVQQAEQEAAHTLQKVLVNISGGQPLSRTLRLEADVTGGQITDIDIRRALSHGHQIQYEADQRTLHAVPVSYDIDGTRNIRDPRGMFGTHLGIEMHLVSAASSAVQNLSTCVSQCHLEVDHCVITPFASGLGCLVDDEKDLGVTIIDMGGGTTQVAVFAEGKMVYTDCVPVGGFHVTCDIAQGLTTSINAAERLKTLHGAAKPSISDKNESITVEQIGDENEVGSQKLQKSVLVGIIQPRLEEIFELVRSKLEMSGFDKVAGRRVVLTGGASQLPGTAELAQLVLDKQIRLGRPMHIATKTDACRGPEFTTVTGLLQYAVREAPNISTPAAMFQAPRGMFGKMSGWLRENF